MHKMFQKHVMILPEETINGVYTNLHSTAIKNTIGNMSTIYV